MVSAAPLLQDTGLLGDRRRFARLRALVTAWAQHAEASLAQALAAPAALKAAYRFFASRTVTPAAILATARPDCLAQMVGEERVLLVQDTTALDFTAHRATRGLGPTGTAQQQTQGVFVHSCLAVSTAGVPLGLAAQQLWRRDPAQAGSAAERRDLPVADKESGRWLAVEAASLVDVPATVEAVTVADAEADVFALFAAPRPAQAHLLIRVAQPQRCLADGQALGTVAAAAPVWGAYTVTVHATPTRRAREALCRLRVCPVTLRPPGHQAPGRPFRTPVALTALWVEEDAHSVPPREAPLQWLLLTTLPVPRFLAAATCVAYYSVRWLVERYHYLLKTGCQVERLQLQEAARLERAVAVACLMAVRVLWLTLVPRETPDVPCTVAFAPAEWQALCCATSRTPTPPPEPPSLREAVRRVAQLGGFLGRKSDGEPGPLTLWRGLTRLRDLTAMWTLLRRDAPGTDPVTGCG
jgi:hypothetical protein